MRDIPVRFNSLLPLLSHIIRKHNYTYCYSATVKKHKQQHIENMTKTTSALMSAKSYRSNDGWQHSTEQKKKQIKLILLTTTTYFTAVCNGKQQNWYYENLQSSLHNKHY